MNGLAQITIAGQQVGLKFGMPAIRRIAEKMQQYELVEGENSNDLGVVHILYAGYVNHCAMRDAMPVFAFEAFYDYVENAAFEPDVFAELRAAVDEFEASRVVKSILDKNKKKVPTQSLSTGTTLNPSVSESSGVAQPAISG